MKTLKFIVTAICLALIVASCTKEGSETLTVPIIEPPSPLDEVLPDSIEQKLTNYMTIYKGSTPPIIEGTFLVSKHVLVGSSLTSDNPGKVYSDMTIQFYKQNAKTIKYRSKESSSSDSSANVTVMGSGKNFTAFFTSNGTSYGIYSKRATIISGTITSTGIKDYYFSFVMLEKGSDPSGKLVNVGTYRIFKDDDYLAAKNTWKKSIQFSHEGKCILESN